MSRKLDRAGIFRAIIKSWGIKQSASSQSVAINMEFAILGEIAGNDFVSWHECDEHIVYGDFWIVKKDGGINATTVDSLVAAFGWDGNLRSVNDFPPAVEVQITVNKETYNDRIFYKASWINHRDYTPGPDLADDGQIASLDGRFGSMLRAAAASAQRTNGNNQTGAPAQSSTPGQGESPAPAGAPSTAGAPGPGEEQPVSSAPGSGSRRLLATRTCRSDLTTGGSSLGM